MCLSRCWLQGSEQENFGVLERRSLMGGGHEWEVVAHGGSTVTVFTLSFNVACVGQPFYKKLRLHKMLSIGN